MGDELGKNWKRKDSQTQCVPSYRGVLGTGHGGTASDWRGTLRVPRTCLAPMWVLGSLTVGSVAGLGYS